MDYSRNYLNAHLKLSDPIRGLTRINSSRNQDTQYRLNEEIEKNKEVVQKLEKAEENIEVAIAPDGMILKQEVVSEEEED